MELISYSTSSNTSLYDKAELIIRRKSTYIIKKINISDSNLKRKRRELHSKSNINDACIFYSYKKNNRSQRKCTKECRSILINNLLHERFGKGVNFHGMQSGNIILVDGINLYFSLTILQKFTRVLFNTSNKLKEARHLVTFMQYLQYKLSRRRYATLPTLSAMHDQMK